MKVLTLLTVVLFSGALIVNGVSAHDHEDHNTHMDKMHEMMPSFSTASTELKSALGKGDAVVVKVQADKMLASIPDMKMCKPHKNTNLNKKFVTLATSFERHLKATNAYADKGDFTGAKEAFKKVEKTCVDCHAKFKE